MVAKKGTHGGARKGAGRTAAASSRNRRFTVMLSAASAARVEAYAQAHEMAPATALHELIEAALDALEGAGPTEPT